MTPIKNKDLIAYLQTLSLDLPIAYCLHSEAKLMELDDIKVIELQPPRPDGWIHDKWHGDPVLPTIQYVLFPGN